MSRMIYRMKTMISRINVGVQESPGLFLDEKLNCVIYLNEKLGRHKKVLDY